VPFPYADIAIPNVPKETLTYAIPEDLQEKTAPGMRVVVPLGRRFVTGYIVAVHDRIPDMAMRPIHELLDARPVFSPEMIRLCIWISRYYLCGLGEALKASLPQGVDVESERFVSLATDDKERLEAAIGRSRTRRQIIDALSTGEVMSEEMLRGVVGLKSVSVQLRDLMMEGVITIESVLERPAVKTKTVSVVRLLPPWNRAEKIAELMDIMERRAPKQVNILAVLWRMLQQNAPTTPMSELLRLANASNAQVRALEEKDIVEILQEEVTREVTLRYEELPREFTLTGEQRAVLDVLAPHLRDGGFAAFLLHGVTGSGKTQVYIEAIRATLEQGKTALMLVPEISLTPQLVHRFRAAFGKDVAVLHSRMSLGERYDAWRLTLDGRYRIIVGVRSAVFAPLARLGLIVVDEEHESGYKQSDLSPRYHARDAAVMRGAIENAAVLLGSATPSAESFWNAQAGKYRLLEMPNRIEGATLPTITAVDMLEARKQQRVRGSLSEELLAALRERVARKEGSIILQNRRGYAPHLECDECGYVEQCANCSISMTYHKDRDALACHYCGATRRLAAICPQCGGIKLELIGAGTQRIEEDLREALPEARIIRMDLDTTRRKGAHDLILTAFGEGEADILLGTQMVAKGLDFDRVTLVGVVSAEQSLLLPDFRAGERTFQILTQVSGRAGRGASHGEVILQTPSPQHPIMRKVYDHDYRAFIDEELASRQRLFYPPFSRLLLIEFSGAHEGLAAAAAGEFHRHLKRAGSFFILHPPVPAILKKINNRYRYHILIRVDKSQDPDGSRMAATLREARERYLLQKAARSVRVEVDVDPQNLL
jgi:primosomal protein N' (replication factor Y) (superfamily II helicase)